MEDLSKSVFFDARSLAFVRRLLINVGQGASPISGDEVKLKERAEEVRALDRSLENGLISLLTRAKNFVTVNDALFFLLTAQKRSLLQDAEEVLTWAITEERTLTREALIGVLKGAIADGTPMAWGVMLLGEDEADRYAPPAEEFNKSSIDLNKLRDFK